jgi:hypothetical protein
MQAVPITTEVVSSNTAVYSLMQEKFDDVQVVVGSHKSKVKQCNDLMKKDKRTINNLQNKFTEN